VLFKILFEQLIFSDCSTTRCHFERQSSIRRVAKRADLNADLNHVNIVNASKVDLEKNNEAPLDPESKQLPHK
jgi:hypothetical protein